MIVDTSAVVAIIRREAEARRVTEMIVDAEAPQMSAANYLEAGIVLDREANGLLEPELDGLLTELRIVVAPVTASQARRARDAHRNFGRGSGHPAKLNYGDCFAYALATETGRPLLYKGDDFFHAGFERLI